NSIHPECRFHLEIQEEETKCAELLRTQTDKHTACPGVWDNITCWRPADVGETVTVPCPQVFSHFYSKPGNISKNCTREGWSEAFPDFIEACGYSDPEDEGKITFYVLVKAVYTLGYSVSLVSLATGSVILCLFRKLHCTRNYIHLNLFLSFILRAISVLVKDNVLYSSSGTLHCPDQPSSWVGCKLSLVFFQYCIMANFYWLLVEGLYLHTLLVAVLPRGSCFLVYLLIGWGIPTICVGAWTATRLSLEDTGCWDTNEHSVPWWVIRMPILISILLNFILFISIIRILLQKLMSPDVAGNDQSQYKRLAKSTLLLIPLFGVHYVVFAAFPIGISAKYQILFELCVGSFQGLVVAVLYCFLNSEGPFQQKHAPFLHVGQYQNLLSLFMVSVLLLDPQPGVQKVQCELRRRWPGLRPPQPSSRDYRLHSWSISRNGSESALQTHRDSRTQSFLQTETSVL
ncbi:Vasoactive intestinal polypeptide receptor 2, partial [Sciurus carolinensis]|nr:Vasoactive intestinal polypeptide receptor 2 [Sciurus carolinensis]